MINKKRIINLDNLSGIPKEYIDRLSKYDLEFSNSETIDILKNDVVITEIISDIDDICEESIIIGFHYTRAILNEIKEKGLLIRSGSDIRELFLRNYSYLFTKEELDLIKSIWENNIVKSQSINRDNIINLNFTKIALSDGGAEKLLSYYGGEQIYSELQHYPSIEKKLKSIGQPIIVKCKLNPKNISFFGNSFGLVAVSTYQRLKNNSANQLDYDVRCNEIINPENIVIKGYNKIK